MIVLNDHVFLCKEVIKRQALVYCNKMHYHRYHTVFLPSDVFRRILSQMSCVFCLF